MKIKNLAFNHIYHIYIYFRKITFLNHFSRMFAQMKISTISKSNKQKKKMINTIKFLVYLGSKKLQTVVCVHKENLPCAKIKAKLISKNRGEWD